MSVRTCSERTGPDAWPRAVLIEAHPGHELLLHHWLERARPIVCALTDGSGQHGSDRAHRSRDIIQRAGAQVGPVFSETSDRGWYKAILSGDPRPFEEVAARILDLCRAWNVTQIVADAFEYYNPMHDLCSCLAQNVWRRLETTHEVELLTYPIERPDLQQNEPAHVYVLDEDALKRKFDSAAEYLELAAEVVRKQCDGHQRYAIERLFPLDTRRPSLPCPDDAPFYEQIGRDRVSRGIYNDLITYETHVQPLAAMLTGRGA